MLINKNLILGRARCPWVRIVILFQGLWERGWKGEAIECFKRLDMIIGTVETKKRAECLEEIELFIK